MVWDTLERLRWGPFWQKARSADVDRRLTLSALTEMTQEQKGVSSIRQELLRESFWFLPLAGKKTASTFFAKCFFDLEECRPLCRLRTGIFALFSSTQHTRNNTSVHWVEQHSPNTRKDGNICTKCFLKKSASFTGSEACLLKPMYKAHYTSFKKQQPAEAFGQRFLNQDESCVGRRAAGCSMVWMLMN
ncbi:unnamed protein product [Pleuronectes platessa]|uniref:Uncharacterized protein n=1 Tax=Pleuronectes platessa TaxID=8262 RepID=A0A9N7V782_PLEPL|nr:unnamed protein product [Pleuronectes platessa]